MRRGRRPHEVLTPFSPAPGLQPLTVVIDAPLIDRLDGNDLRSPEVFLGGLLSHDLVRLLRYADEGPPRDLPRSSEYEPNAVRGWVVVRGYESDIHMWSVAVDDGNTVGRTGFGGDFPDAAEQDPNDSAYSDLDSSDASARRRADVIAAQAAAAAEADIFITTRPYLFSVGWEVAYGLLVATPVQALPLVSLYLRAQGEFIDWRSLDGKGTSTMNRGLFYQRSVMSLVPRLFGAIIALSEQARTGGDASALRLTHAILGRLQQTVVARDEMYWGLNRPQNRDIAFEVLTAFDLALLTLMGAVDTSARLAHHLLGLESDQYRAGWHRDEWRGQVAKGCPAVAAAVEVENRLDAITVLRKLRNTIHAALINPIAVSQGQVHVATRIELPADDAEAILASIDRLGGRGEWGVEGHAPGRYHADPAELLDHLLARLTPMLNDLLAAMSSAHFPAAPTEPGGDYWSLAGDPAQTYRWQIDLAPADPSVHAATALPAED